MLSSLGSRSIIVVKIWYVCYHTNYQYFQGTEISGMGQTLSAVLQHTNICTKRGCIVCMALL